MLGTSDSQDRPVFREDNTEKNDQLGRHSSSLTALNTVSPFKSVALSIGLKFQLLITCCYKNTEIWIRKLQLFSHYHDMYMKTQLVPPGESLSLITANVLR